MNFRSQIAKHAIALTSHPHFQRIIQPDYPLRPSQFSFFYGWIILIVCTIGIIMSIPGQTVGVSVFTDPLIQATGLSRLQLSNAYLIGTLSSGLLLPLGGRLLDRWGARAIAFISSLWLAATLCYLSLGDRLTVALTQLLSLESGSVIALILLITGFTSLRFSGQGMLTMVSRTTLGKWFDQRRGFVSGVSGIFVSFGFACAPLLLSMLIDGFGWRNAWFFLAALVGVGMGAIAWLFYRDNPEVCGLQMDGLIRNTQNQENAEAVPSSRPSSKSEHDDANRRNSPLRRYSTPRDFTRSEALRTLAFWAVTLALSTQALTVTGITFHIVDIGTATGLSRTQTVAIFLPIAIFSTLTGYLIGIASDRTHLKVLFIGMMLFEATGIACAVNLGDIWFRGLAVVGLGVSGGCFGTLSAVALPRYFGRSHLGAISGIQMMSMVIASALGPSLLAIFKDYFGTYRIGLYVCAAMPIMLIIPLLMMQNPQEV
ncbi:MAG: MFS transporter [Elainellaceae cyanobacterium]